MKFLTTLIKANSVILLICFFLPFIVPMCDEKKATTVAADTTMVETDTNKVDTTASCQTNDSTLITNEDIKTDSIQLNSEPNEEQSKENVLLEFILKPDGSNYSGIGYMYAYSLLGLCIVSLPISFILIALALIFKKWPTKVLCISLGLFSLICFGLLNYKDLLFGYWIALVFYITDVTLHWVAYIDWKRQKMQG